jgi:hypothetical protein
VLGNLLAEKILNLRPRAPKETQKIPRMDLSVTRRCRERRVHLSGRMCRLKLNRSKSALKMRSLPLESFTISTKTLKAKKMKRQQRPIRSLIER